jgi:hypothetical protein
MYRKTFLFNNQPIEFENWGALLINATQMAKPFGKTPEDWLKLPKTKKLINETREFVDSENFLAMPVVTTLTLWHEKDVKTESILMHEELAFEFAKWLSPELTDWCRKKSQELCRPYLPEFHTKSIYNSENEHLI